MASIFLKHNSSIPKGIKNLNKESFSKDLKENSDSLSLSDKIKTRALIKNLVKEIRIRSQRCIAD